MNVSSRTPEGFPVRCAVCGQESRVLPSWPWGDAVCPRCGQLVWAPAAVAILERLSREFTVKRDQLRLDTTLAELGADSLAIVELVMELEEAFDFHIRDYDAEKLQSIEDVLRFLEEQLRRRQ
jgi:acyl carrier protein